MRITQGAFSFLPELTDAQISAQVEHALGKGWAVSIEVTDDPHPRNCYWEMWGMPMFGLKDAAGVMTELKAARTARPQSYIRINAFDSTRGWETIRLSFIVNRPDHEPGFHLDRIEEAGRVQRYAIRRKTA
jgi:ribulose-bisphosphate carboxylase small chain